MDFLDGDPDRPIITGRVYNEDNMPPFGMEVSGLKSKTVKGGGYNELSMHDSAGGELFNMRAQRDMVTTVLNDQNASIQNNKSTSVAVNHAMTVGANQTIAVGANRGITVTGTDTLGVTGTRTTSVTGAVTETFQAGQTKTIAAAGYRETVTGDFATTLNGNFVSQRNGTWKETVTQTSLRQVIGKTTEQLSAGREVTITGLDKRSVQGAVEDANVGARTVSVDGSMEQAISGTHTLFFQRRHDTRLGQQAGRDRGRCRDRNPGRQDQHFRRWLHHRDRRLGRVRQRGGNQAQLLTPGRACHTVSKNPVEQRIALLRDEWMQASDDPALRLFVWRVPANALRLLAAFFSRHRSIRAIGTCPTISCASILRSTPVSATAVR